MPRSPVMASRMAASRSSARRGHVGDGVDVAGRDAAAVGADDAAEEGGVLVVLHDPRAPLGCQGFLTLDGRWRWRVVMVVTGPRSRCIGRWRAGCSRAFRCRRRGRCGGRAARRPIAVSWAGVACRLGRARSRRYR